TLVGLRSPDVPRLRRQVADFYAAVWPDFAPTLTGGFADLCQFVLDADINAKGARRHKFAGTDQFAYTDLISDIGKDLVQALAITTIGCCGDTKDAAGGIAHQRLINDTPVAVSGGVMRLVDHQQIKCGNGGKVGAARQGLHHGEGDTAVP